MKIEFIPYIDSLVSHPNVRMAGSILFRHKRIAAFVSAVLASMAAYYFINRRPCDHKNDITPQLKKPEHNSPNQPIRILSINVPLLGKYTRPFSPEFPIENRPRALICYQYAPLVVLAPIIAKIRQELIELISHMHTISNQPILDQQPPIPETPVPTPELTPAEQPPSAVQVVKGVVKTAAQILKQGIDLTPYFLQTLQAGVDFWNTPSQPYDPFTSNLMVGFARKFGKNFHFLLLNTSRLRGPEFAGQLVMKLEGVERIGNRTINNCLKFCNPLGWGSLILQLADLGVNTASFMGTGMLEQLNDQIDQWLLDFVKKLNIYNDLDLEYFEKKEQQKKADAEFEQEIELYKAWLIENGKVPSEVINQRTYIGRIFGIFTDWYVDCIDEEGFEPADSYREAEKAKELAKQAFEKVQRDWYNDAQQKHDQKMKMRLDQSQPEPSFPGQPDDLIFEMVLPNISQFLKLTNLQTLTSLVQVLGEKIDSSEYSSDRRELAKASLKTLILGDASWRQRDYKKAADTVSMLNNVAKWVKNPASVLARFVPDSIKTEAKMLAQPLNKGIGNAVGIVVTQLSLDEKAINQLKLQELEELFPKKDLKLDVSQLLPNGFGESLIGDITLAFMARFITRMQKRAGKNVSDKIDFDYNQTLQKLIQTMGEQVADRLSYLLAVYLKETSQSNYSPEDLMTKRVGGWFS